MAADDGDDLHAPLGRDAPAPSRLASLDVPWGAAALGGVGVLIASLIAFTMVTDDPFGGQPFARVAIETIGLAAPKPSEAANAPLVTGSITPRPPVRAAEAEAQSGVRVVRQGQGSGALIIQIPQNGARLAPTPDPRLVQKSRFGPLPRIGADGARPMEAYARPDAPAPGARGAGRVAIMVGGLGLSAATTQAAIDRLPGAVTLAFAPYGAALERQAAAARDQGHENMLQAPMEAFDAAPPGLHTLTTQADPALRLDDLHWLMGRMTGYIGVANFLGAKFLADEAALAPVLREIGARGLLFLDDGSAPQSLASALAPAQGTTNLRADLILDAAPRADAIDAALARLEAIARERGSAIGVASALPLSIERIAGYAAGMRQRGVTLTPLSALVERRQEPQTAAKAGER